MSVTSMRGVRRAIKEAFILVSNLHKNMHCWIKDKVQ